MLRGIGSTDKTEKTVYFSRIRNKYRWRYVRDDVTTSASLGICDENPSQTLQHALSSTQAPMSDAPVIPHIQPIPPSIVACCRKFLNRVLPILHTRFRRQFRLVVVDFDVSLECRWCDKVPGVQHGRRREVG